MQTVQNRIQQHNQVLDIFKFFASCLVVFIHASFPGKFGKLVVCMARCAVPGFFAISGYFSYGATSDRLLRRVKRLFLLNIMASAVALVWGAVSVELGILADYQGSSIAWIRSLFPNLWHIASLIFIEYNSLNGFFWYLLAALKCYAILWCYVRFFGKQKPDYRMFYLAGMILYIMYLLFGVISNTLAYSHNAGLTQGTFLLGIPMFAMGMFIRQYADQLWENFQFTTRKLLALILLGIPLSILERVGAGDTSAHVGSVLIVICILLLADRYPRPIQSPMISKFASKCGSWSVGIYVVHAVVIVSNFPMLTQFMDVPYWSWVKPVYILLFSLTVAIANDWLWAQMRKMKKRQAGRT